MANTEFGLNQYDGDGYLPGREKTPTYVITVTKTPKGPAPWCVRRQWKGVEMVAIKNPVDAPQFDSLKNVAVSLDREAYRVPRDIGLRALERSGKKRAFDWFSNNWPEDWGFSFAAGEVDSYEF
jgi:hypothetical protein